jgi:organic radical activating enzyme
MVSELKNTEKLPLVEEFFSIQGEGFFSGKAAWFIRLGGCDIGCRWCDSRFTWDRDYFLQWKPTGSLNMQLNQDQILLL